MRVLWEVIHHHPIRCCILAVLISSVFFPGIERLTTDTSSQPLIDPDSKEAIQYQFALKNFGDDVQQTILVRAPDVFRADVLRSLERLTRKVTDLEYVTRIVSLSNANNLTGRDGVISTDALIPEIPDDPDQLRIIREDALANEVLVGEVVNENGSAAAINLFISGDLKDGWALDILNRIEAMLDEERAVLPPDVSLLQVGSPFFKTEIERSIGQDISLLAPLTLLVMSLLLIFFFRSLLAVLIPAATGLLSVGATLGFMGYLGLEINPMNTILPALIMVIGATEDIHMLSEYANGIADGLEKKKAVLRMLMKTGRAICLTTLTTFAGFAALLLNHTPILHEFGMAASFGIVINFVLTVLLVPTILQWAPVPSSFKKKPEGGGLTVRNGILWTSRRPRLLLGLFLILGFGAVVGSTKMEINTSYGSFFREDSEMHRRYGILGEAMQGGSLYMLVVRTGEEEAVYDPEALQMLEDLRVFLARDQAEVVGYTEFIKKLHLEMNDGDPQFNCIPDSRRLIAQYTLLPNPDDLGRFLNFDRSTVMFLVRSYIHGSQAMNEAVEETMKYAEEHLPEDWEVIMTGESVAVSVASDRIAKELLSNLVLMFAVVFIVMSLFLRSIRAGLVALIPNTLPVLTIFGVMGWFDIPLSTATFPVALVALGIAVDDTVHMMVRFGLVRQSQGDLPRAIRATLDEEIRPVLTTSVALTLGFLVLLFGEFASVAQFGLLSALAMASALVADLLITPMLLRFIPPPRILMGLERQS
jgi:hydrophobe/amphiphile efflux-3 (HAE3) family protein